jgi:hypothetical protein
MFYGILLLTKRNFKLKTSPFDWALLSSRPFPSTELRTNGLGIEVLRVCPEFIEGANGEGLKSLALTHSLSLAGRGLE